MKDYLIKKGRHRPCLRFSKPTFNYWQNQVFLFNDSCWFWFNDPDIDGDWSKVMGFVIGFNIHGESYRFGMRPCKDVGFLEFTPYIYQKGKRLLNLPIKKHSINSPAVLKIALIHDIMEYHFNNNPFFKIEIKYDFPLGFTTGIYIGGGTPSGKDWAAPHDIIIKK